MIFFNQLLGKVGNSKINNRKKRMYWILDSTIRIVTLNLAIMLLKKLVFNEENQISYLSEEHMLRIEQARKQATEDLRRYYPVKISKFSISLF